MSDRAHATTERPKAIDAPTSRRRASPAPEALAPALGVAAVSRLAAVGGRESVLVLRRFAPAHQHQALLALQRTLGNIPVQRLLVQRSRTVATDECTTGIPPGTGTRAPLGIQRDPKLDEAKANATAASTSVAALQKLAATRERGELSLGQTKGNRDVKAHFFQGVSSQVALVIAGVHGSELSGVEIAELLVQRLSAKGAPKPYYCVVIVPQLFPDNVEVKRAWEASQASAAKQLEQDAYRKARDAAKDPGRYTAGSSVDPNRQFPELDKPFDPANPVDAKGRPIERENIMLLTLIDRFDPVRIAALHAIKNPKDAGIYADPHPSVSTLPASQKGLATDADKLAEAMATVAKQKGAQVPGNWRGGKFSSLYPGQDPKMSAKQMERENKAGRSLGQWGPSQGAVVLTIEVNEQYASDSPVKHPGRKKELEGHAAALQEIFLGPPTTKAP